MLTHARIRDEVRPAQLDWISALRAPQIKALVEEGALQLSLFDTQDLLEISSPEFPGERLVCCHNPALAEKRARKRQDLLAATEKETHPHRRRHRPRQTPAARQRQDRAPGGQSGQPLQDGQTLHPRDHRRVLHLHPQHRGHRRRGRPRRDLRAAHQPARTHPHPARRGAALQEPRRCRAVLPHPQQRTRRAAHPASAGRPGARPHVLAHAVATTSAGT